MKKPTDGNVFIVPNTTDYGLTKRDWFAGMAMIGLLSKGASLTAPAKTAEAAYNHADAMITERHKNLESKSDEV